MGRQPAAGSERLWGGGAQYACWRGRPLHCTGRQPAAGFGRLRGGGAQDARGRGRPLYCTGRQPAAGSGRLRGGGAQDARGRGRPLLRGPPTGSRLGRRRGGGTPDARWHGRPLHCTGRQPAAGFGRLRGGGAQDARGRGRPLYCTGRKPAAGTGRLRGSGAHDACWRGRHIDYWTMELQTRCSGTWTTGGPAETLFTRQDLQSCGYGARTADQELSCEPPPPRQPRGGRWKGGAGLFSTHSSPALPHSLQGPRTSITHSTPHILPRLLTPPSVETQLCSIMVALHITL